MVDKPLAWKLRRMGANDTSTRREFQSQMATIGKPQLLVDNFQTSLGVAIHSIKDWEVWMRWEDDLRERLSDR